MYNCLECGRDLSGGQGSSCPCEDNKSKNRRKVTADKIRAYREKHNCSLMQAKRDLELRN